MADLVIFSAVLLCTCMLFSKTTTKELIQFFFFKANEYYIFSFKVISCF